MSIEGWQTVGGRAIYRRSKGAGVDLIFLRLALLILWPLSAFSTPPNAEPERPYLVISETTSPNGHYAVAWTLPKGPQIDWEKFRSGERNSDYLPDLDKTRSDILVEDNLIELQSGRKLAMVASGYWALPENDHSSGLKFRPNDEFMEVAWTAQSDLVLVLHRLRSGPEWGSFRACQFKDETVVAQLDCGEAMETAARGHLKKLHPKEYARHKDDLNLRFDDLKSLGGSKFSLGFEAALTNEHGNRTYKGSVIKFELRPEKNGKLSLHVLGFTEMDLEEEEAS